MESTVKPCYVRLVRLKAIKSSQAKVNSNSTAVPQRITTKKEIRCPVCKKPCKWNCELEIHFRVHTGERPFGCNICNKKFKSQAQVSRHLSTVHNDCSFFSCVWCDKSFKDNAGLLRHLRIHTKERPYFCEKCSLSFPTNSALSRHVIKEHNSGNGKKCEYCEKMFYSTSDLKRHRRIHTGEKPYPCLVCGKSFAQRSYLVSHSGTHSERRPFKCTTCSKTFRFRTNLHSHTLDVHEKVRNYSCVVCGKTYFTKKQRDEHLNSHLNEKPFLCPKCPKRFPHRSSVAYHLKAVHENRRNFKCSKCLLAFVDQADLNKHFLRRHGNPSERPFACLFCSKKFCARYEFENHLRSHLAEKPYFCTICHFSSGMNANVKKHMRKIHRSFADTTA